MSRDPAPWNPSKYLTYADERGRAFFDLVNRIGTADPADILDLGCGPGNLTATLTQRWPAARITGIDSSPAMIERARADHPDLTWRVDDVRAILDQAGLFDVVLSNAMLQWVPGHLDLLPGLLGLVRDGGHLAFQVPGNFGEPSHALLHEIAAQEPYRAATHDVERPASHDAATYLATLRAHPRVASVDAWETTYLHVLDARTDPDPVFTWVSATGARPVLNALPHDVRPRFVAAYQAALRAAYPAHDGAVVLPFRRIFVIARTRGEESV